jgi:uncharacterized membrane protein YfcA
METWDSRDISSPYLWLACALIYISGLVMQAGGAGGGGVFVAILMSVLSLTAHEAVPLSKLVILLSAICTFIINSKKNAGIIDFTLVRAIVPLSLAGTLIGILINTLVSDGVLLVMLCFLMAALLIKTVHLAATKYIEESKEPLPQNKGADMGSREPTTMGSPQGDHAQVLVEDSLIAESHRKSERKKNLIMSALVPIVVICGVLGSQTSIIPLRVLLEIIPISGCIAVAGHFIKVDQAPQNKSLAVVGFLGGIAAGLFGVGGGLIYSPVLLNMGIDPAVVIAVSSTGVLFASASTALQYLFMGRIPAVPLGLLLAVFGIAAAMSAFLLVRFITRKTGKKYPIFFLVAGAVALSSVVTLTKTIITV